METNVGLPLATPLMPGRVAMLLTDVFSTPRIQAREGARTQVSGTDGVLEGSEVVEALLIHHYNQSKSVNV